MNKSSGLVILTFFLSLSVFSQAGYRLHKLIYIGASEADVFSNCDFKPSSTRSGIDFNIWTEAPLEKGEFYKIFFEGSFKYYYINLALNESDQDADEVIREGTSIEKISVCNKEYLHHKLIYIGASEADVLSNCNYRPASSTSGIDFNLALNTPLEEGEFYKIFFEGSFKYYYVNYASTQSHQDADEFILDTKTIEKIDVCDRSIHESYKMHRLIFVGHTENEAKTFCCLSEPSESEGVEYGVWLLDPLIIGEIYKVDYRGESSYYYVSFSSIESDQDADEFIGGTATIKLQDLCASFEPIAELSNENYVLSVKPLVPSKCESNDLPAVKNVKYYDGLGRPMQNILINGGGQNQDIVSHITYDDFGRSNRSNMPYASTSNSGFISTNPQSKLNAFYNTTKYENTSNPYSEERIENSPLNRVLEQGEPGEDWKLNENDANPDNDDIDHTIKIEYGANRVIDFVRNFSVNLSSGSPQLVDDNVYAPNSLYKTISKDENWQPNQNNPQEHTTEEYRDKYGRVVLKRTFNEHLWHDTYYVYDVYGNLTYVLPPEVLTYRNTSQKVDYGEHYMPQEELSKAFVNEYDYGGLHISIYYGKEKPKLSVEFYAEGRDLELKDFVFDLSALRVKLPSLDLGEISFYKEELNAGHMAINTAGNIEIKTSRQLGEDYDFIEFYANIDLQDYDEFFERQYELDQTALDKFAYQYKYDDRNRIIEKKLPGKAKEHIIYDKLNRPILTQDANLKNKNRWLFTKYDAFGRIAYTGYTSTNNSLNPVNLQRASNSDNYTAFENKRSAHTVGGTSLYYTNTAVPTAIIGGIYTVNYYDNYNVDLPNGLGASITTSFGLSSTSNTNGLPTVSKVRVLETNHWISTVTYYDAKARPIYVYSENSYLQTVDILESLFDFRGNVIETKTTHRKVGQNAIEIYDTFTYDHMQRIKTHKQRIGDHTEVIAENRYDELGRLEQKSVGGNETVTNRLQNIDYSYNVRGWLKDVNDPKKLNATNDLFGFAIDYNRSDEGVTAKSLFNGNISGVYWKTDNNSSTYKGYEYTYDALNRFERAKFSENKNYKSMYDVSVYNYDRNGNIKRLVRKMPNSTNTRFGTTMDNLKYTYNGNQLLAVKDYISNANGLEGFNDGNTTGNDYLYDANGNMVVDKNKNITEITYNHLNLPETVSINDGGVQVGTISYTYDATGEKLEKTVSTGTTTSYAGNYIYENNSLKYFNHPEGYVETNGNNFEYVYQYKDHLGNIRLSYKDTDGNGSISGNSSSVFYDGINANSSGWNSRGAKYGSTAHPSTAHVLSGESSIVLRKTSKGDVYAHSNTWIPIRNSEPTEYIFSGWIYAESTGSSYQSSARLVFFMNKETETDYATQVEHSDVVTTKNKWVYIEKRVFVPPLIDKINLRVGMYNGGAFTTNVWFDNLSIRKVDHIQDIEIIEENNYYPFGLKHKGYNNTVTSTNIALRYKFGGKELNDELGLDWYDVSARNYDPAIARWMNIDPLAELMRRHSPYNYAFNNPIIFQDPDGMAPLTELFDTKGNKIGEDENGNDGNVSIVSNNEDVKRIKKNTKKGKLATKKDVESGLQTTKTVLKEALNVLQRTIDNGGKTEEGSIVDASGNVTEQKNTGVEIVDGKEVRTLEFDQTKSRKEEGDVSIHSHPTEAEVSGGNVKSFDAKSPSASHDLKNIFPNYNQNVIVGRLGITTASQSGSGGVILHKPDNGVVFFDKVGNINLSLKSKAAQKILK